MRLTALAIVLALVASPTFADEHKHNKQSKLTKLSEQTLSGTAILENVSHDKDLTVKGYLQSERSNFNNLIVYGRTEIDKSEIKGLLELHGSSEIEACSIVGPTTAHGRSEIEQSHFEKEVKLHGATDIEDSNFQSTVIIHGEAKIEDSTFAKGLTAHGKFKAEGTTFAQVTLFSQEATFEESHVNGNLTFNKSQYPQTLILSDTTIKGDIVFVSGNGTIIKDEDSTIDGKIKGAQVSKKK